LLNLPIHLAFDAISETLVGNDKEGRHPTQQNPETEPGHKHLRNLELETTIQPIWSIGSSSSDSEKFFHDGNFYSLFGV